MFRRLQAEWRLKLLLTVLVNAVYWPAYAWLSRHAVFPLRVPPRTWFDDAIAFQPDYWAWVYLSQFPVAGLLPWLIVSRESLMRYVRGMAILSGVSFAVFLFFPTASPRGVAVPVSGVMQLIQIYDGTLNAFPSLHAGFLVYLALLARRMFPEAWAKGLNIAFVVWGGAVLYATIATRQHYATDLMAGGLIGWLADWVAWRRAAGVRAATTMSRSSGVAFQDGCK